MPKATFPYTLVNNLDKAVKLKQAEHYEETGESASMKDIYNYCGDHCGVSGEFIRTIKAGVNKPSVVLAFLIADYFNMTVDQLFDIRPNEGGPNEQSNNRYEGEVGKSHLQDNRRGVRKRVSQREDN